MSKLSLINHQHTEENLTIQHLPSRILKYHLVHPNTNTLQSAHEVLTKSSPSAHDVKREFRPKKIRENTRFVDYQPYLSNYKDLAPGALKKSYGSVPPSLSFTAVKFLRLRLLYERFHAFMLDTTSSYNNYASPPIIYKTTIKPLVDYFMEKLKKTPPARSELDRGILTQFSKLFRQYENKQLFVVIEDILNTLYIQGLPINHVDNTLAYVEEPVLCTRSFTTPNFNKTSSGHLRWYKWASDIAQQTYTDNTLTPIIPDDFLSTLLVKNIPCPVTSGYTKYYKVNKKITQKQAATRTSMIPTNPYIFTKSSQSSHEVNNEVNNEVDNPGKFLVSFPHITKEWQTQKPYGHGITTDILYNTLLHEATTATATATATTNPPLSSLSRDEEVARIENYLLNELNLKPFKDLTKEQQNFLSDYQNRHTNEVLQRYSIRQKVHSKALVSLLLPLIRQDPLISRTNDVNEIDIYGRYDRYYPSNSDTYQIVLEVDRKLSESESEDQDPLSPSLIAISWHSDRKTNFIL